MPNPVTAAIQSTFSPLNLGLTAAFGGPEAARKAKSFIAQQRAGTRHIRAQQPAGEIPNMQKVSARDALRFYMRKHAAKPAVAQALHMTLGKALALGAAGTAGGMLVGSGLSGVGNVFQRFQATRMFSELQNRYPEVKKHPDARKYFDMIVAYAPSLLRHHAAVGDFLRRQLEYPMSSVEFLKQLADLEAQVTRSSLDSVGARFGAQMVTTSPKWLPAANPRS